MFSKLANHEGRARLVLLALAALFFLPWLGGVHLFDWDEINFAEAAREMIVLKDYLRVYIGYMPFWEKPPLFLWLQAASMHLFGVGEFAARFPNAVCGMATLLIIHRLGSRLYNPAFGLIWALAYGGSVLPFFYFKSGIIDPWFNLFIFLGLYFIIRHSWVWRRGEATGAYESAPQGPAWGFILLAGLFTGLGILTKGPVALLVTGLVLGVYLVVNRFRLPISIPAGLTWLLACLLVVSTWFGLEYAKNGPWFITEFFTYQYRLFSTPDAGHGGFPGYHFVVLLAGCFPASVFAIRAMGRQPQALPYQADFERWMMILFWVVLLLFSYIKTKIVHYSSLCYLPLTYLAALTLYRIYVGDDTLRRWMRHLLVGIGSLLVLAPSLFMVLTLNRDLVRPLLAKDPFAQGNLDAAINWWGIEWLASVWYAVVLFMAIRQFNRQQVGRAISWLFGGTAVMVLAVLVFCIGRAEAISQNANIEFLKTLRGKDCYVVTHGYKSFAHYFYTDFQPGQKPHTEDQEAWKDYLFRGPVDKEVYVSCKITAAPQLDAEPNLQRIGAKNGFVFYKRALKP